MKLYKQVHAVVVNFQTPDLLETAVASFQQQYPNVPVLIVDNGSQDRSLKQIQKLETDHPRTVTTHLLSRNRYHGPAMHLALEQLNTPYVYFFDSDTVTTKGGFLEPMVKNLAASDLNYGTGQLFTVNQRGFPSEKGTQVLISAHMLIKRSLYATLPPFKHHGLPVLNNMHAAHKRGYRLVDYPIQEHVDHLGRGTASRYGYGLGLQGKLDYLLNKMGL